MPQIRSLARKLCASYPWTSSPLIVGAPMRIMSGPALAVAVSGAGGLGFIGPSAKTKDVLPDLDHAKKLLEQAQADSSSAFSPCKVNQDTLPVGLGFQLWSDDVDVAISGIEKYKPCAVWLFAPRDGQKDFDLWTRRIRHISPATKVWIQIGTLAEAKDILQGEKPDVVVVQGAEAGGHGRAKDGMGLMTLLPEIADAFQGHGIPLVAAGGIADGRGAAAAVCLGASGVAMGTRFLAATEARISKGYQNEIVRATDGAVNTTRTVLYNQLRGTVGWPDCFSPRTVINKSWTDHQSGVPFEELKKLHDEAAKAGNSGWGPEGRLATYAGAAIGLIHEVEDASLIVNKVREEASQYLVGFNDSTR